MAVAPRLDAEASSWRAVVSAMAQSGGSSLVSGALSALAAKIIAAYLGPAGTALVSTLQQTRDTAVVAATANGRTAVVQGMSAFDPLSKGEYLRTALLIFLAGILATVGFVLIAGKYVAAWVGLSPADVGLLSWLAIPIALTSVFVFVSAVANAMSEIGRLAWAQVAVSAVTVVLVGPFVWFARGGWGGAVGAWLTLISLATVVAGYWTVARHTATIRGWLSDGIAWWNWQAARQFFSISGAMLATGLLSSFVLLGLRSNIIRTGGLSDAGRFDAAWTISMRQVTLVLSSLQTYFLPALARARDSTERAAQIGRVLMVTTLVMAPLVAALELTRPLVLGLFYSDSFRPAAALLRWTLVGDYLKVTSWVLAMPMLAVADMKIFACTDVAVQGAFLASAVLLSRVIRPSESVAIGFAFSYAVNLVICYGYAHRRHAFFPEKKLQAAWLGGLMLVLFAAFVR